MIFKRTLLKLSQSPTPPGRRASPAKPEGSGQEQKTLREKGMASQKKRERGRRKEESRVTGK